MNFIHEYIFRGDVPQDDALLPSPASFRSFLRPTQDTFDVYDENEITQPLYSSGSELFLRNPGGNFGGGRPSFHKEIMEPENLENNEMEDLALLLRSDYPLASTYQNFKEEKDLPYNNYPLTTEEIRRVSRLYNVGKREKENSNHHSATEFLPLSRNKRIGARNFMVVT